MQALFGRSSTQYPLASAVNVKGVVAVFCIFIPKPLHLSFCQPLPWISQSKLPSMTLLSDLSMLLFEFMISAATLFPTPAFYFCFVFRFQDISSVRSIKRIVRHWQVGAAVWPPHFVLSHCGPVLVAGLMYGTSGLLVKMGPASSFLLASTLLSLSHGCQSKVFTINFDSIYN